MDLTIQSVPTGLKIPDINTRTIIEALDQNQRKIISSVNSLTSSSSTTSIGSEKRIIQYQVDGSKGYAVGTHPLQVQLPKNTVITNAWYDVIGDIVAVGGSIALGVETDSPTGILGTTSVASGFTSGLYDGVPDNTAANFIKTTDTRSVIMTVSTTPISGGFFNLFLEITTSEV
jgi:hypothetical protein